MRAKGVGFSVWAGRGPSRGCRQTRPRGTAPSAPPRGESQPRRSGSNTRFLQKEYNRAIDYYTRAAELDSEDGGIWINLSMAQYKAGELKQARSSYQRALELEAGLANEHEAYGKLLSQ